MTVYITASTNSRVKYHTEKCYHTDDISTLREVSKTQAERMGLELCDACQGNRGRKAAADWSYQNALRNHE